jgi:hypothetical protein
MRHGDAPRPWGHRLFKTELKLSLKRKRPKRFPPVRPREGEPPNYVLRC